MLAEEGFRFRGRLVGLLVRLRDDEGGWKQRRLDTTHVHPCNLQTKLYAERIKLMSR
jgi:hypothetical protein